MKLYALHGFLGRPSDWQEILPDAVGVDLIPAPFDKWAKQFNDTVEEGSVLVGYSLGGRLAMHALIQNPKLWKGAVIISAKTGMKEGQEPRLANDRKWAKRFLNDPWDQLMHDWNSQPVFAADKVEMKRREEDYDRLALSVSLEQWSLGKQAYLEMRELPMPIFWITGEKDPKAERGLTFAHPKSKEWAAPGIGHRVPWECPTLFQQQLHQFLGEIG